MLECTLVALSPFYFVPHEKGPCDYAEAGEIWRNTITSNAIRADTSCKASS